LPILSDNFVRLEVSKVFEQCRRHFHHITSVDEILKRICAVSHSNDPVARAVTLRCDSVTSHSQRKPLRSLHLANRTFAECKHISDAVSPPPPLFHLLQQSVVLFRCCGIAP